MDNTRKKGDKPGKRESKPGKRENRGPKYTCKVLILQCILAPMPSYKQEKNYKKTPLLWTTRVSEAKAGTTHRPSRKRLGKGQPPRRLERLPAPSGIFPLAACGWGGVSAGWSAATASLYRQA